LQRSAGPAATPQFQLPPYAKNALVLANKVQRSRSGWFILNLENLSKK
jgi:hypothetical protein